MNGHTDTPNKQCDRLADVLESLNQVAVDQRRINILLTRMVRDQGARIDAIESSGAGTGAKTSQARVKPKLEIGKDVPAYPMSDLDFLRKSEVFGALSDDALRVLLFKGELRKVPKGTILFDIGSPADALCVIKEGVIEIARPVDDPNEMKTVAYFTNSDAIGEMRIITKSPHRSMARVPGGAEVFILTREALVELIQLVPELAMLFIEMYAHKLEGTVSTLRTHEQRQRQLEGNLEYFDLATVIQTLLSTDQRTGILQVNDDKQKMVAELFIDEGTVKRAKMGRLSGEDAFYQLFQSDLKRGTFFFKEDIEVDKEEAEMELPGMSLLMEAARLQDELSDIRANIVTDPKKVYKQTGKALEWAADEDQSEDDKVFAQAIWNAVGKGLTVQNLVDTMPRNEYSVYRTLATLVETKQIA